MRFAKQIAVTAIFTLTFGCSTLNNSGPSIQDRLRPNIAQRDKTPAEIYAEADYLAYIELDIEVTDDEGDVEERKGWLSGALIYRAGKYYILTAGHITQTGGKIIKISAYLKNGVGPEEVKIRISLLAAGLLGWEILPNSASENKLSRLALRWAYEML